jgi:hypothetical protein
MSGVTPSQLDLISAVVSSMLGNVHTCMPGEVMRVFSDAANKRQFVDVLPSLQRAAFDELGLPVNETLPIVPMVPVAYPQGGGFFISVPLSVGDFVLLLFAERSIDQWLQIAHKKGQRAVDPGDVGLHPLEGAIALPCGPAPRPELLDGIDAQDLVIAKVGGPQLRVQHDGTIKVVGDLAVTGSISADGEVYAGAASPTSTRALTTHTHNTAMGPSGPPNP